MVISKVDNADFETYGCFFSRAKTNLFSTYYEKYPLLRTRRRPEGAAGGSAMGICSKLVANRFIFSKHVENIPSYFSKFALSVVFQITII